jgi:hypothetical protein
MVIVRRQESIKMAISDSIVRGVKSISKVAINMWLIRPK